VGRCSTGAKSLLAGLSRRDSSGLLAALAAFEPGERDKHLETWLGIADGAHDAPPGDDLIGYHASGVAAIVRALIEVPVVASDVFVDLGSGLGKVALLAHLLTGARARGVDIQKELVRRANANATALGVDVPFTVEDARDAKLDDGSVFFLYAPFTGPVLEAVVRRLGEVAEDHAIVVVTLGMDLPRSSKLVPRDLDAFWLTIYDGAGPNAVPRHVESRAPTTDASIVAFERAPLVGR